MQLFQHVVGHRFRTDGFDMLNNKPGVDVSKMHVYAHGNIDAVPQNRQDVRDKLDIMEVVLRHLYGAGRVPSFFVIDGIVDNLKTTEGRDASNERGLIACMGCSSVLIISAVRLLTKNESDVVDRITAGQPIPRARQEIFGQRRFDVDAFPLRVRRILDAKRRGALGMFPGPVNFTGSGGQDEREIQREIFGQENLPEQLRAAEAGWLQNDRDARQAAGLTVYPDLSAVEKDSVREHMGAKHRHRACNVAFNALFSREVWEAGVAQRARLQFVEEAERNLAHQHDRRGRVNGTEECNAQSMSYTQYLAVVEEDVSKAIREELGIDGGAQQ